MSATHPQRVRTGLLACLLWALLPLVALGAYGDRIVDISDPTNAPGGALPGLVEGVGSGAGNAAKLQNIFDACYTNDPDEACAVYVPPGIWEIDDTVTIPNCQGGHLFGGGGMVWGYSSITAGTHNASVFRWTGDDVGPMIQATIGGGWVIERIVFDGVKRPYRSVSGVDTSATAKSGALETLIAHKTDLDGSSSFGWTWRNCTFVNAQRLYHVQETFNSGIAELTFHKCKFIAGEDSTTAWTSNAVFIEENQTVNCLWDNCEFNTVKWCIRVGEGGGDGPGGRVIMRDTTVANCGGLLRVDDSGQNVNGHLIDQVHVDMQGTMRCEWYKSLATSGSTGGPVVLSQIKPGNVGGTGQNDEFNDFDHTVFTGSATTLTLLDDGLRFAEGDRIYFIDNSDLNHRTLLGQTTISDRVGTGPPFNGDKVYVLAASPTAMGFTPDANTRATFGEALITMQQGEQVNLRDCYMEIPQTQVGRLARMVHTDDWGGGRSPRLYVDRCMGFLGLVDAFGMSPEGFRSILTLTGDNPNRCFYRFNDCYTVGDISGAAYPMSATNIPDYPRTTDPTVNHDITAGYVPGAKWLNLTTDTYFVLADATDGAAVWTELGGGGGSTLPVNDTTALVKDPTDNTKLVRLDAGSVATGTTRALFMPNADVTLVKNNYSGAGAPTINDDSGDGYDEGSLWVDTTNDAVYVLTDATTAAAVWKDLSDAGGGTSPPFDDTLSIVRDTGDTSKQVRLEAGNISTSTTRVLTMPNSDVQLRKNTTSTVSPGVNEDSADGYQIGSMWFNIVTDEAFVMMNDQAGAAVWVEITGGGSSELPVPDTDPLVRDPLDATKLLRLDAGAIATATTRAIFMPNADVQLTKDNLTAVVGPSVNDDVTLGYAVNSRWIDTAADKSYVCVDATDGSAVWNVDSMQSGSIPPPGDPQLPNNRIWQFARGPEIVGTNAAIVKQPAEEIIVAGNFNDLVATTESIDSITTVTAQPSLGVTVSGQAINGNYVEFELAGGNNGQTGPVTVTVTTSLGNVISAQGVLQVRD